MATNSIRIRRPGSALDFDIQLYSAISGHTIVLTITPPENPSFNLTVGDGIVLDLINNKLLCHMTGFQTDLFSSRKKGSFECRFVEADQVVASGAVQVVGESLPYTGHVIGGGWRGPPGVAGETGPTGPQGPAGPSGSDLNYLHMQIAASTVWNISHNLGRRVAITLLDDSGEQFYAKVIQDDDLMNATVFLNSPKTGKAECS